MTETMIFLTLDQVAERSGLTHRSIRIYNNRARAAREDGTTRPQDLPAPDLTLGRTPRWKPETIDAWNLVREEYRGISQTIPEAAPAAEQDA
jgi:hypothetical protein